jgi:predicted RNase H-like HicB family nuclease
MKTREYTIVLLPEAEEGGYSVLVPALPGCVTQGETIEEAIAMAKDAIAGWIAVAEKHGEPIPEEAEAPRTLVVTVAA